MLDLYSVFLLMHKYLNNGEVVVNGATAFAIASSQDDAIDKVLVDEAIKKLLFDGYAMHPAGTAVVKAELGLVHEIVKTYFGKNIQDVLNPIFDRDDVPEDVKDSLRQMYKNCCGH